ncbi:MAG: hypothetical protein WD151_14140, partial [Phycisphaeraceae bacterium]
MDPVDRAEQYSSTPARIATSVSRPQDPKKRPPLSESASEGRDEGMCDVGCGSIILIRGFADSALGLKFFPIP